MRLEEAGPFEGGTCGTSLYRPCEAMGGMVVSGGVGAGGDMAWLVWGEWPIQREAGKQILDGKLSW